MLRPPRRGFTLVELLVVIAVIGLLIGLLMPVFTAARNSARRVDCQIRLRQIGLAMNGYLDAQGPAGCYPDVAVFLSVTPEKLTMAKVLESYLEKNTQVFACPRDEKYYPVEQISYEYKALQFAGKTRKQALTFGPSGSQRPSEDAMLMYDFDPVHGAANLEGSRNVLYADGRVDSL
ncbi:MAG: type II secretion system GspH family protein [Planctomycetia bacterium]|nr:type II secretion system GspH family protein [Planctomycetia bacterium]